MFTSLSRVTVSLLLLITIKALVASKQYITKPCYIEYFYIK